MVYREHEVHVYSLLDKLTVKYCQYHDKVVIHVFVHVCAVFNTAHNLTF